MRTVRRKVDHREGNVAKHTRACSLVQTEKTKLLDDVPDTAVNASGLL